MESSLDSKLQVEKIFDEFAAMVLGYIKTLLCDTHRSEDVLQNVFIRLYKSIDCGCDVKNIKAYLFTIARNECFREIEKGTNDKLSYGEIFEIKQESMEISEKLAIEEALLSLPCEQREIVYLKVYGELTFQEIAQELKISQNTVASRYRYAMEKLTEFLN